MVPPHTPRSPLLYHKLSPTLSPRRVELPVAAVSMMLGVQSVSLGPYTWQEAELPERARARGHEGYPSSLRFGCQRVADFKGVWATVWCRALWECVREQSAWGPSHDLPNRSRGRISAVSWMSAQLPGAVYGVTCSHEAEALESFDLQILQVHFSTGSSCPILAFAQNPCSNSGIVLHRQPLDHALRKQNGTIARTVSEGSRGHSRHSILRGITCASICACAVNQRMSVRE